MSYKKNHKYFDKDSDPWRRRITRVPEDDHPVGLRVLFMGCHPNTSGLVKSFVGQEGKVLSHSHYPWESEKWCVRFIVKGSSPVEGRSLWLRPIYLKILSEDHES